jgi:hypothetical protein
MTDKDREALIELRGSMPMARSRIDAGLAIFNADTMASLAAVTGTARDPGRVRSQETSNIVVSIGHGRRKSR